MSYKKKKNTNKIKTKVQKSNPGNGSGAAPSTSKATGAKINKNMWGSKKMGLALSQISTFMNSLDLEFTPRMKELFGIYLKSLVQWNQTTNLIGELPLSQLASELIVDSLQPLALKPLYGTLLDVGSGAGLPGIPLAICCPNLKVTLVEPRRHRIVFMERVIHLMKLQNCTIRHLKLYELEEHDFDVVISKALCEPVEWINMAAPYLGPLGTLFVMTTIEDWTSEALAHAAEHNLKVTSTQSYRTAVDKPPRQIIALERVAS